MGWDTHEGGGSPGGGRWQPCGLGSRSGVAARLEQLHGSLERLVFRRGDDQLAVDGANDISLRDLAAR